MKGIIYTRVSSEEQTEGTSLKSQDELCRAYCAQKGLEVVGFFREEGETAKDLSLNNRSQFLAALEYCRKSRDVDAFVVFRVDRFARNTEDHFSVRRLLMSYGTSLHSVTEPIGNKPAEKFIETVLAGAAEYDNAIRKQRCTDGMKARIDQGIWPFKAPPGYVCAHHRLKGEKKTVPDEPDAKLFPIVQRGLKAFATGEFQTQTAFVLQLNAWGFADAYGRRATVQLADRLLGKFLPFYAGFLESPWTKARVPGQHEPMITEAEAARIYEIRFGPVKGSPTKRHAFNPYFPLRRLLRCSECQSFVTGAFSSGNGGKYGYYYCTTKGCALRSKMRNRNDLNPKFSAYLRTLRPSAKQLTAFSGRLSAHLVERYGDRQVEQARFEKRLADLRARRKRICDMREEGVYDADVSRERLAAIDRDIALATASATLPSLASISTEEVSEAAEWLLTYLSQVYERITGAGRPRFEKLFFPEGVRWHKERTFRTITPGLILALIWIDDDAKSHKVHLDEFSSNQLYEYFTELIAFHRSMLDENILPQEDKVA